MQEHDAQSETTYVGKCKGKYQLQKFKFICFISSGVPLAFHLEQGFQ